MSTSQNSKKKVHWNALLKKKAELMTVRGDDPDVLTGALRSPDTVELAAQSIEQDVATWKVNLRFETLREVDEALVRMEKGDFGTCESCGETIASNRLRAIPWARFCVGCQEISPISYN